MKEFETKPKKWGNSLGITIPKEIVEEAGIKEGKKIKVFIREGKRNVLKETFGTIKFKKTAQQMKNELREELYD